MTVTSIEWTRNPDGSPGRTWNCIRGCSMAKGSEKKGCLNCYACALAARDLPGMRSPTTGKAFARRTANGPRWTGAVELIPSKLDEPLRWRRPTRVFVNSMSDLFHEALSDEAIAAVFAVMLLSPQHTFQILTKRPERMRRFLSDFASEANIYGRILRQADAIRADHPKLELSRVGIGNPALVPARWIWLGVSVEDQTTADERIPLLLQTPAAVRWVSYEPALGPVDFRCIAPFDDFYIDAMDTPDPRRRLDWIVVGGESGPGARPFDVAWARSTVRQCRNANVPVFVKQFGARPVDSEHEVGLWAPHDRRAIAARVALGLAEGCEPNLLLLKDRKGGDPDEWPRGVWPRQFPVVAS